MSDVVAITALLPVWTGEEYLEECIQSIRNQTFSDWEMLIIGEPDGPPGVKRIALSFAFTDPRINWIENETHLGLPATLNRGIRLARGKYIARVDADDPSMPLRFEKQRAFLDRRPDVDILGSQCETVSPRGFWISDHPTKPENISSSMLFKVSIWHSSIIFRRESFLSGRWAYPDELAEDFALWLSLLDKATFVNLDDPLVKRRTGYGNNVTYLKGAMAEYAARSLISNAIKKYFGIPVAPYPSDRFLYYVYFPCEFVKISELSDWFGDSVSILLEMESANFKYQVFDHAALSRTLRNRWNWMLNGSQIALCPTYSHILQPLPDKSDRCFSEDLKTSLSNSPANFCCAASLSDIVSSVRKIAFSYSQFLTDLFRHLPVVIIFGLGYFFDKFVRDKPDLDEYFIVTAYCDNQYSNFDPIIYNKPIISPDNILAFQFDYVLIASIQYFSEIHSQLVDLGVPMNKILPLEIFRFKGLK